MRADPSSWGPTVVLVPLVALLLYRRARRLFGKQKVAKGRMVLRMVLFTLFGGFILITAKTMTGALTASSGLVLGAGLGVFSLTRTKFDVTREGFFYTPDKWIGIAVTALFVGRLIARFVTVYQAVSHLEPGAAPPLDAHRSVVTGALVLLMVGYYGAYNVGILRKNHMNPA